MKVTELAAHWRATAARLGDKPNVAGLRPYIEQLTQCADELEQALAGQGTTVFEISDNAQSLDAVNAAINAARTPTFTVGDVVRHRETARRATVRSYDGPDSDTYEIQYHDHHTWATVHSSEITP